MWGEADIVGTRKLAKQRCLDMDWSNTKEITAIELAWCICEYNLDTNKVPEIRQEAVKKELIRFQKELNTEQEHTLIKAELAIYEVVNTEKFNFPGNTVKVNIYSDKTEDIIGYCLDPDLFHTSYEAHMAKEEFYTCWNNELFEGEIDTSTHKNTRPYSRDFNRMQTAMAKVREQYIRMGGLSVEFDKHVSQIPMPHKETLKESVDSNRKRITKDFIAIGTSPTRAKRIATAITTEAYSFQVSTNS